MTKKMRLLSVCISLVVVFLFITAANAGNVSQNVGLKDVEFSSLSKPVCQDCHGDSLVDTHHTTQKALTGQCVYCHNVSKASGSLGVTLMRDCMSCHLESPHHSTEAALNNECTGCHDSPGLSDYSMEVASYGISRVTPAVANCGRCHGEGEEDGMKIVGYEDTHHGTGIERCEICHTGAESHTTDIRICERCHSVQAVHEVAPHIEAENCAVCHLTK